MSVVYVVVFLHERKTTRSTTQTDEIFLKSRQLFKNKFQQ